jgi:hypothetical protein
METREIARPIVQKMRDILLLDEHAALPAAIVEAYWRFKRLCDRIGEPMRDHDLVIVAFSEGHGEPIKHELLPPTVVELYRAKKLKLDDIVTVNWRGTPTEAFFKGVGGGGEAVVLLDGEAEERKVPPADVSVPEHALASA